MKNKILLYAFLLSLSFAKLPAQVGIGVEMPHNSAVIEIASTTKGLLLPRITEPQRNTISNPAEGLMIFNTTCKCLEYFNSEIWISIGTNGIQQPYKTVKIAWWGTNAIGSGQQSVFNSQLLNTANYGRAGTFMGIKEFSFSNISSTLSTLTAQNLIDNYDIISIGTVIMNATDAAKIKSFVDGGGVVFILLDNGTGANNALHQVFGGIGNVGTGAINATANTTITNNGIFGDARNTALTALSTSARVPVANLPVGSTALATETEGSGSNAAVWFAGNGGRAFFIWDEGVFRHSSVAGTVIDTQQERFLHNLLSIGLQKAGFSSTIVN